MNMIMKMNVICVVFDIDLIRDMNEKIKEITDLDFCISYDYEPDPYDYYISPYKKYYE